LVFLISVAPVWAGPQGQSTSAAENPQTQEEQKQEVPEAQGRFHEELTVVARPILEGQEVTPFAGLVARVSDKQISDLNAGDLAGALRRLPGVTVSRYNLVGGYGGGDGGAVFVRGQGSGRPGAELLTLIDGVPRFVGVWTHPLLDLLPTDEASAIEVYKSAQPVLFGNMAFAAVNMVPKKMQQEGRQGRFLGSWGTHSTAAALAEEGGKLGKWDYYLLFSHRQSDGHRADADGRVRSFFARVGYELAPNWQVSAQVHGSDAWAQDPGFLGAPKPPVIPRFQVKDTLSIVTLSHSQRNNSGALKLYSSNGDISWLQWDGSRRQAFTTDTDFVSYGVRWQESLALPREIQVVMGLDLDRYGGGVRERRPASTFFFPRLMFRNSSAYAMVAKTFGQEVKITPSFGVRYTDSSAFGGKWGEQAGLVVRAKASELHANFAEAFNFPGVYAAVMYQQWGRGQSWRDLEAEELRHWEVGFTQGFGENMSLGLTAFQDRVRNALRFVPPPPPPPAWANLGSYRIRGLEAVAHATPWSKLALFLGATVLRPEPKDVPNAPRWSWTTGISWLPLERLRLNLDAERVARQAVLNPRFASNQKWIASFSLVNLKASYGLNLSSWVLAEIWVAAENLLDANYELRPGYPAPGRVVMGGLEVRF
jgi:iron complex outermembrane receptor protein